MFQRALQNAKNSVASSIQLQFVIQWYFEAHHRLDIQSDKHHNPEPKNQAWRVEMNLFTKNIRGFVDFGKQAEPKNPCVIGY